MDTNPIEATTDRQAPDAASGLAVSDAPSPGPVQPGASAAAEAADTALVSSPAAESAHRRLGLVLWIPLVVVALDQSTKALLRARLPLHESREIIPGLLDFTHVQNTGAAFGFLNTVEFPFKPLVLAMVAAAALAGIAFYASRVPPSQWIARAGLALIVGGAAGNLIDRLTTGYVLDFVDAYWRGWHFWAFNVADAAITCGVVLTIVDLLGLASHASTTA